MAIGQVKTIDNEKRVLPLAGSVSTGNPVGSLLYTYKKLQPRNYLYCDGSTFNAGQYPALAMYLGGNVLPDYRECGFVGAEENTTDQIETHDVYAQGEFKDDQIQNITGKIGQGSSSTTDDKFLTDCGVGELEVEGALYYENSASRKNMSNGGSSQVEPTSINFDASRSARAGTVTHGKRKAVYVYIKAVDGVDISDEDTFLNTVKNFVDERVTRAESYSTTEQWTGGYWIDGKPIYRKVLTFPDGVNCYNQWRTLKSIEDEDTLISAIWYNITASTSGSGYTLTGYGQIAKSSSNIVFYVSGFQEANKVRAVAYEYTKSTD